MPVLERSVPARVVNVSSAGNYLFAPPEGIPFEEMARRGAGTPPPTYEPWRAYGISKLANVLHAFELNRRGGGPGRVAAVSLHPGAVLGTELTRSISFGGMLKMLFNPTVLRGTMDEGFRNKTLPQGAATTILAALAPFTGTRAAAGVTALTLQPGGHLQDCGPSDRIHPRGHDPEQARQLWELSERLVAEATSARPEMK
jgi:hypothetical protein